MTGPADASTFVDTPDEPTAFLELPRLEPAPDAQPAAWPAPTGPARLPDRGARAPRPALVPAVGSRREAEA